MFTSNVYSLLELYLSCLEAIFRICCWNSYGYNGWFVKKNSAY